MKQAHDHVKNHLRNNNRNISDAYIPPLYIKARLLEVADSPATSRSIALVWRRWWNDGVTATV